MPTAYSYVRFSSLKQKKGTSELRQEETPEPWCKENGYTLDTVLSLKDEGRSGYHGNHITHGKLGVFLQLVKDGRIERGSVLLVEHLDRFTRQNPMEGLKHIQAIISEGVDIVTLMDGERYSASRLANDFGCLMKLMFNLFQNREESDKKSKRLTYVWKQRREKVQTGVRVNKRCPAWLDRETLTPIDQKADLVRRIFKSAADGAGPYKIAATLNTEGVKPIGKGKSWSGGQVRYLLTSRTTIGEFQSYQEVNGQDVPIGDPVPGIYPPIIDRNTFLQVQQELAKRLDMGVKGRVDTCKNLFTRILYSLYDGGRYHYKQSKDSRWSGCVYDHRRLIPKNRVEGIPGSMTIALDYDAFEQSFFDMVKEVDVVALFSPKDQTAKSQELADLQANMIDLDGRIRTMKERIKKSKNIDAILDMVEEAESEKKAAVSRIETLKGELITSEAKIFEDMKATMGDPTARGKVASAIRLLIDRIDILPIHVRTGRHRKVDYILYAEVRFTNGQIRYIMQDADWVRDLKAYPGYENVARVGVSGITASDEDGEKLLQVRKLFVGTLIEKASDEWKPRLKERFLLSPP